MKSDPVWSHRHDRGVCMERDTAPGSHPPSVVIHQRGGLCRQARLRHACCHLDRKEAWDIASAPSTHPWQNQGHREGPPPAPCLYSISVLLPASSPCAPGSASNALPLCASTSATASTHICLLPSKATASQPLLPHAVDRFAGQLFARSTLTITSPALVSLRAGQRVSTGLRRCLRSQDTALIVN